jgi:hypothetical protein
MDVSGLVIAIASISGGVERQEGAAVLHHGHARLDVPRRRAVVDERLPLARGVERRHVGRADFEFERRRDAIERVEAVVLVVLPMHMQVDEARRDDQPLGVDHLLPLQRTFGDRGDPAPGDPD